MSVVCSRKRQSYSSFRLQVFKSLFAPSPTPSQRPFHPAPGRESQHGFQHCRTFRSSAKLSKQAGSRNVQTHEELRVLMERRLVTNPEPSTPSTNDSSVPRPDRKTREPSDLLPFNPYKQPGHTALKGLLSSLNAAANEMEAFEEEYRQPPAKGARAVKLDLDESPVDEIHPGSRPIYSSSRLLSRDLPESPLMRRLRREAKHKRAPTDEELVRLWRNPWATILASPVRYCQGTGVRLPRDLMVPWGFITRPKDSGTYLVPHDLAVMKKLKPGWDSEAERWGSMFLKRPMPRTADGREGEEEPKADDQEAKEHGKPPYINILPYQPLVEQLTSRMIRKDRKEKESTAKGAVQKILPHRTKANFKAAQHYAEPDKKKEQMDLSALKWQPDIAGRMKGIMRARVLTALETLGVENADTQNIEPVPLEVLETGAMAINDSGPFRHNLVATDTVMETDDEEEHLLLDVFAGSFLLHVNARHPAIFPHPSPRMLSAQAPALLSQTINLYNTVRLPLFDLTQLMGKPSRNVTARRCRSILQTCKALRPAASDPLIAESRYGDGGRDEDRPYLLLISRNARGSYNLLRELWQLWRYQGGSADIDCSEEGPRLRNQNVLGALGGGVEREEEDELEVAPTQIDGSWTYQRPIVWEKLRNGTG